MPYERILVERDSAGNVAEEYLRINPMGQVPTLRAHFERTLELGSVRQAVAEHRMNLP